MKRISFITAFLMSIFSLTVSACSKDVYTEPEIDSKEEITEDPQAPDKMEEDDDSHTSEAAKNILVVYYSHSGNTKTIAEYICEATGADSVSVETVNPYPESYDEHLEQARREVAAGFHPEIKTKVNNIQDYDVVFVGYPIWVETAAPPIASFLVNHNLSGKTIVPFCTSGTSSASASYALVKSLCPESTVLEGLQIRRGTYDTAQERVMEWLKNLKIISDKN